MTRPQRTTADTAHAMQVIDNHGPDLFVVATMLTDDADLAARLVVRAAVSSQVGDALHGLSASVVRSWLGGHPGRLEALPFVGVPTLLDSVRALTAHQRASLALCRFGDHTYRETATLLDVPAAWVADLLCATLRSLRAPDETPEATPLTA